MKIRGGLSVAGYTVGVLHLASRYPLPLDNAQHAQTYPFPVCFEEVPVGDPWALMQGDPSIEPLLVAACQRLVSRGGVAPLPWTGSLPRPVPPAHRGSITTAGPDRLVQSSEGP